MPKIIYFIVSAFRYAVNGGALLHKGGGVTLSHLSQRRMIPVNG